MTVAVTGANGFVGRAFCGEISDARPLCRPHYNLRDPVDPSLLAGCSSVVHCAWDLRTKNGRVNVDGALRLLDAALAAGVGQFVFISSMAAHDAARSVYGRSKFEVEKQLSRLGGGKIAVAIVKPGTVLGDGGLVKSVTELAGKLPALPLFYASKRRRLQTVKIADLTDAISRIVDRKLSGNFVVAEETGVTVRAFYTGISPGKMLLRCWGDGALLMTRSAEAIGLRLPITSDNLLGLKYLRHFDTTETNEILGITPRRFEP